MADKKALDALTLRDMVSAGAALLEKNRDAVNQLNVFPVPDGDTGTNMSMTMMAAVKELNGKEHGSIGEATAALAKGALRGARGNSGVILSQLFRGFSKALENVQTVTPQQFAAALKAGSDTAYKAVMKPKEGTILTVARVIADDATRQAELAPDDFSALFRVMLVSGEAILKKTEEMLPALKAAGVVDAGGRGLLLIYAGYSAVFHGEHILGTRVDTSGDAHGEGAYFDDHDSIEEIRFAYCTEFFIQELKKEASDAEMEGLRRKLSRLGDCVLVVGDENLLKVHLHTNEPGRALQFGVAMGELAGVKIDNMHQQRRDNLARKAQEERNSPPKDFGLVSVSLGEGFSRIFKDLGVDAIVDGGQTMNPSIEDLARALENVNAKTVFVLPNNGNVILAAQQAAELAEGVRVIVLPTKNVAMGIAAIVAFQPEISAEENERRMNEAAEKVRTGTITFAVRDSQMEGLHIKEGSIIGLNNGQVTVNVDSITDTALELMEQIVTDDDGLITIYYGQDTDPAEAQKMGSMFADLYPMCDVEVLEGGQPLYYYLISVE